MSLEALVRAGHVLVPDWPVPPGVRALVTLRRGAPGQPALGASAPPYDEFNLGERCGDDPAAVLANRAALRRAAALPSEPAWLRQVHGIAVWQGGNATGTPEGDAAVTARAGQVLAILTADCLPVLFAARDGREVGAAHAGWRGLAGGVLEATVAAMRTAPADLVAWLGPAAGPANYEIGEDVHAAFVDADAGAAGAFAPTRPGHWRVDLYALARRRLAAAGVHDVHGGGECTIADAARFFSHRRDRACGRMATLVWRDA